GRRAESSHDGTNSGGRRPGDDARLARGQPRAREARGRRDPRRHRRGGAARGPGAVRPAHHRHADAPDGRHDAARRGQAAAAGHAGDRDDRVRDDRDGDRRDEARRVRLHPEAVRRRRDQAARRPHAGAHAARQGERGAARHRRAAVGAAAADRLGAGDGRGAAQDRARRPQQRDGADPRRERHGQGGRRPRDPRRLRAARAADARRQLRRAEREPAGVRALRTREGRVHRGRQDAPRPVRAGGRRHAAAGRDQRDRPAAPGQAAPGAAGERVRARRQQHQPGGRRARDRDDEPRPGGVGRRGQVPPGPVLPAERGADRAAPAAAAGGGRAGAEPALFARDREARQLGVPARGARGGAPAPAVRLAGQRAGASEHRRARHDPGAGAGRGAGGDDRAVAQEPQRRGGGLGRRGPRGQAAGRHREAGDPQHAPAVQGPPHQDGRRAGHRRADAGHEAEALEGRRRVGRAGRM
ncbi:MAG: Response regulator of zinc sigma-54-dependent two-component system, partial [uncultured Phycisphaerae bacterium]